MGAHDAQINQAFAGTLRRAPNSTELAEWGYLADTNQVTVAQIIDSLIGSGESTNAVRPVIRLYQAIFNRKPDDAGLTYWVGTYETAAATSGYGKATLAAVCVDWFSSSEYTTAYPSTMTTTQYVTAVYNNVFGRAPDSAGLAYWEDQLDTEATTRQAMIVEFSESPEFADRTDAAITAFQQAAGSGTEDYTGPLL